MNEESGTTSGAFPLPSYREDLAASRALSSTFVPPSLHLPNAAVQPGWEGGGLIFDCVTRGGNTLSYPGIGQTSQPLWGNPLDGVQVRQRDQLKALRQDLTVQRLTATEFAMEAYGFNAQQALVRAVFSSFSASRGNPFRVPRSRPPTAFWHRRPGRCTQTCRSSNSASHRSWRGRRPSYGPGTSCPRARARGPGSEAAEAPCTAEHSQNRDPKNLPGHDSKRIGPDRSP